MVQYRQHIALAVLTLICVAAAAQTDDEIHREVKKTNEKSLYVRIDVAYGTLRLNRVEDARKIVDVVYKPGEDEERDFRLKYRIVNGRGELSIESKQRSVHRHSETTWDIALSADLPMDLEISFGAGRGILDITELKMQELKISSGASSVDVRCDKPNTSVAEEVQIEAGVGELKAYNLSNLNFRRMKFSGGVGSYDLNFGGELQHSADVGIEIGVGSIMVSIPREIPVLITKDDSWFSSFKTVGGFEKRSSDKYETDNYRNGGTALRFNIESGIGNVKVIRR